MFDPKCSTKPIFECSSLKTCHQCEWYFLHHYFLLGYYIVRYVVPSRVLCELLLLRNIMSYHINMVRTAVHVLVWRDWRIFYYSVWLSPPGVLRFGKNNLRATAYYNLQEATTTQQQHNNTVPDTNGINKTPTSKLPFPWIWLSSNSTLHIQFGLRLF